MDRYTLSTPIQLVEFALVTQPVITVTGPHLQAGDFVPFLAHCTIELEATHNGLGGLERWARKQVAASRYARRYERIRRQREEKQ